MPALEEGQTTKPGTCKHSLNEPGVPLQAVCEHSSLGNQVSVLSSAPEWDTFLCNFLFSGLQSSWWGSLWSSMKANSNPAASDATLFPSLLGLKMQSIIILWVSKQREANLQLVIRVHTVIPFCFLNVPPDIGSVFSTQKEMIYWELARFGG